MDDLLVRAVEVSRVFELGGSAVAAVDRASFEVRPRDTIALVGPSGSGKSTLLHLMAALDRPTSGTIEWPALGTPDRLRPGPVAFAFQGPSLLPPLTIDENVALPVLLAGGTEHDATLEAEHMIARFELDDVATKMPDEVSGGQAQRAGLARALVGRPRLVLADEPTGQQDRVIARRVMDALLATVDEMGAALVVATHDQDVVGLLELRWVMDRGRLRAPVTA
jgi:putative ABC transport system ATP-binding protein